MANRGQLMKLDVGAAVSYATPGVPLGLFLLESGSLHIHPSNADTGVAHEGEFLIADVVGDASDGKKDFWWIRL